MIQKVNIYMDDLRPCPKAPHWLLAKTAEEALALMKEYRGYVNILSLDHDLGDTNKPERNGKWFVNQMIAKRLYADKIYLHTSNGVGRKNMFSYLINAWDLGYLPRATTIYEGPMASYNMATGELFDI